MEYNPRIAKACPFPYYWLVRFEDGDEVAQYRDNGEEVLYREVMDRLDHGRGLSFITWRPTKKGLPVYIQHIDSSWQRPIVFRRRTITTSMSGDKKGETVKFALGWQATIAGKNYKSIMFIDPELNTVEVKEEL